MKIYFLIFFIITILTSCSTDDNSYEIYVDSHPVYCQGVGEFYCLITSTDNDKFTYFYGSIEGFNFQWGYKYHLKVRDKKSSSADADASTMQTSLVEELSKSSGNYDDIFQLRLFPSGVNFNDLPNDIENQEEWKNSTFDINGQNIQCTETPSQCQNIYQDLQNKFHIKVEFINNKTNGVNTLILNNYLCSASKNDFDLACNG